MAQLRKVIGRVEASVAASIGSMRSRRVISANQITECFGGRIERSAMESSFLIGKQSVQTSG
jgi:hypothetical protein